MGKRRGPYAGKLCRVVDCLRKKPTTPLQREAAALLLQQAREIMRLNAELDAAVEYDSGDDWEQRAQRKIQLDLLRMRGSLGNGGRPRKVERV